MKAYINLLPREESAPRRSRMWGISAGIVIVGVGIGAYGVMESRLDGVRAEVATLQTHRDALKGEWEKRGAGLSGDVSRPVLSQGDRWSNPLREISLAVPEGFYLSRMESVEPKPGESADSRKPQALRLHGYARTYGRLTEFMKRLNQSGTFGSPLLEFAGSEEGPAGGLWIRFEILASVTREDG